MDTSNWILKAPTTSKAQDMMHKIHVLLVDHDTNAHAPIVDMFEYFSYKVTSVKFASSAVSMLLNGKMKFDLLVENIKSPDTCGYKLLQIALLIEMPVILLLDDDDLVLTTSALETGVLLCIKKPVPVQIARYLWQLVAREKIRKEKEMERFRALMPPRSLHNGVGEESHKSKKRMKCSENANQEDKTSVFKRKFWIDWSHELHERFVYAVRELGEGRCYPKDILELMNVPGLTRMQVASHLQKCRRGTWLHPAKSKRFGSMPPLIIDPQPLVGILKNNENDQEQVPMTGLSKGDNVLGYDSEGVSQEVYNPFSDVGVKMEQAFDMDDVFMPENKFVIDAQSVTPTANTTSLGDQSSVTDEYFEFPNMDIMIQDFYASEQVPIDDGRSCDLDQVYSNENKLPVVLDTEEDKCGATSKTAEGLKLEE